MELSTSVPVTSSGENATNTTHEVQWFKLPVTFPTNTASDDKPEGFRELVTYPDLIPFVPVLLVLLVVLAMTTIKYVIHAIKIKTLMRMPRGE